MLSAPPPPVAYAPPPDTGLDLVYADGALLVVNKPAGLLSVPGRGEDKLDSLVERAKKDFPDALIVHRLDMDTSGLLVLARGTEMHRQLSILFQSRKVHKRYEAVAAGCIAPAAGKIDQPLVLDWPNRPRHIVDHATGKPSLTRYRVLGYDAEHDTSRVELEPITGRTHQLRVHLQYLGHPILGDTLYAPPERRDQAPRLLLHARKLAFRHPITFEEMHFEAKVPF